MKLRLLQLIWIWLALVASASGQVTFLPVQVNQLQPAGTTVFAVSQTASQTTIIPRYRTGTTYPAGVLIGWGAASEIRGTATTQNLSSSPTDLRWVVRTEGLDASPDISQWQETSTGRSAAVLQPMVCNLTISGHPDATDYDGTTSRVGKWSQQTDNGEADLYGLFRGYGVGGIVDNVTFFYCPGTMLEISRPTSVLPTKPLPHDRLKWVVSRCSFRRGYKGCYMNASDCMLSECEAESIRDWCFRLGGAVMFRDLHAYGYGNSLAATDGEKAGLWLQDGSNQGSSVYMENGQIGILVDSGYNQVSGILSHTTTLHNLKCSGIHNQFVNFDFSNSASTNAYFSGGGNALCDGVIEVLDNQKAIHLASGTAGDMMAFRGVTIAGNYIARHGPQNTGAAGATGIDVDVTIQGCDWHVRMYDLTNGIDFTGGGIGTGNRIWLVTAASGGTPNGVTNKIIWPTGETWLTTPATTNANEIYIDGVRWYKQSLLTADQWLAMLVVAWMYAVRRNELRRKSAHRLYRHREQKLPNREQGGRQLPAAVALSFRGTTPFENTAR